MLINTRAIVGVSNLDEEIITVELFDGTTHRVDRSHLPEITGDEAVIRIVPADLYALYGEDLKVHETQKVDYMAVTASGRIRPMDCCFNFVDDRKDDAFTFLGFSTEQPRVVRK